MKKVLILTYNFPPNNSVGAQRPSSWDKYFPRFGISTVTFTYDWGEIDPSTIKGEVVQVKCPHSEVDETVGGVKKILRKLKTVAALLLRFKSSRFDDKFEILTAADEYLKVNPVDYIIATGEPFILFKYASILSENHGTPWFADYRDDWIDGHIPVVPNAFLNRWVLSIEAKQEQKYLANAAGVVTVSKTLLDQIQKRLPSKSGCVIENGADLELYSGTVSPYPANNFIIAYTGILYDLPYFDSFFEGFLTFLEQVASTENVKAYFIGTEGYQNQATRKLDELCAKCPENIVLLPRKRPEEIAGYQAHAHVLLNLIAGDPSMGLIGAKSYNYAIAKRPMVTIPHVPNRYSPFFPGRDIQTITLDSTEVTNVLKHYYQCHLDGRSISTSLTEQEAYRLSREYNAEKLVAFIQEKSRPK